jgi:hypothetical protein
MRTAACDEISVISWWWQFGIATKLSKKDLSALCPPPLKEF